MRQQNRFFQKWPLRIRILSSQAIKILLLLIPLFASFGANAQDSTTVNQGKEKIKTGWSLGTLPVIAYNSDMGLKYGWLVNFYDFGTGKDYPRYDHSVYLETSFTTKGGAAYQFQLDSRKLLPGWRTMLEATIFTDKGLDFFGFNGYQSWYNPAFINQDDPLNYISRVFYRLQRKLYRFHAGFYKDLDNSSFRWFGGVEFSKIMINTVDLKNLNKGLSGNVLLPDTALLYDNYVAWGVIRQDEKNGGSTTLLKTGLIYDTRNEEPNPTKGVWSEIQLLAAPPFLSTHSSYLRFAVTHRQYFSIVPKIWSFVYRISYQGKIAGHMPFYMLPFLYNTVPNYTRDGLGGNFTVRGVMRNRVVGEDYLYSNFETRWKFLRTVVFNQNVYLALSTFIDAGMVTRPYKFDITNAPPEWVDHQKETIHATYGGGLRICLNDNFILAFDMGIPFNKNDGERGLYIFLNWLF